MEVGSQRHDPAALLQEKTQYPLYRGMGGPQGRSGWVRKISIPPEFDPRTVQPVASRYTDRVDIKLLKVYKEITNPTTPCIIIASMVTTATLLVTTATLLVTTATLLVTTATSLVTTATSLVTTATLLVTTATLLVTTATLLVTTATLLVTTATLLVTTATLLVTTATLLVTTATLLVTTATLLLQNTPAAGEQHSKGKHKTNRDKKLYHVKTRQIHHNISML